MWIFHLQMEFTARETLEAKKKVSEMALLRTQIQFLKKKYVEANQAFSELINLLDRHDEFMIDVNKTCTLVPLSKPLLYYF